ncbi:uncharacterized protein (DUF952 family) [Mycetocola sp. CAN_C7]|uniref:DUF952 domain-containing protein n=1 Tax=Mycetocola sp. CAN_C7 TaxID=2787724 RepID=UPI0018CA0D14
MSLIAHIAIVDDWESARNLGEYAVSTRGVSLNDAGFVHAVTLSGVGDVLEHRYAHARFDLLLIILDTDALLAEGLGVTENTPGQPQVDGPIQTDGAAVVEVLLIERSANGFIAPDRRHLDTRSHLD